MFVASHDVALNDLLDVLEDLVRTYDQLGTDTSTDGFILFYDVNVDNVVGVEFPGQSQMVWALGRGTEDEFTNILILEFLDSLMKNYYSNKLP